MKDFARDVLIFAPYGRDAIMAATLLKPRAMHPIVCQTFDELITRFDDPGAVLLTDEGLASTNLGALTHLLERQAAWSDVPFVLLVQRVRAGSAGQRNISTKLPTRMSNVVYVERPASALVLTSAVEAALAGRKRQFDMRNELLNAVHTNQRLLEAEATLARSHSELERLVLARTAELEASNEKLRHEALERLKAEEALVQAQKMEAVGRLTGGIAHDFNNLLMSLGANLELAQRQLGATHAAASFVANAKAATRRGERLASQLLAFSRTQKLTLQSVLVDELVSGLTDLARHTIGATQELRIALGAPGQYALADANQLELAILNLVSNARDAMPQSGNVTIATALASSMTQLANLAPGDYIALSVTDQGTGINPALLPSIFDPFFTTKPVGKGTGLGLSQVWGITHQCGGTVQVESELGIGTTFTLFLPLSAKPALVQTDTQTVEDAMLPKAGGSILIIDDDDNVRESMVAGLTMEDYEVQEAPSGPIGLPMISPQFPDLLIVDFSMPGMNGTQVARAAQKIKPDLQVLMISGYTDSMPLDGLSNASILHKPFGLETLHRTISQLMERVGMDLA